jgi:hypothetical protein
MPSLERDAPAPTSVHWLAREGRWRAPGEPAGPWRMTRERQLVAAGIVAIVGLLLAYLGVLQQAVDQATQRHRADATHAQARWHCRDLASTGLRDGCLADLDAEAASAGHPPAHAVHAVALALDTHE